MRGAGPKRHMQFLHLSQVAPSGPRNPFAVADATIHPSPQGPAPLGFYDPFVGHTGKRAHVCASGRGSVVSA
jgi:hypothetical protein